MPDYMIATSSRVFFAQWRPVIECYSVWEVRDNGFCWYTTSLTIEQACEHIRILEQLEVTEMIEV